MELSDKKDKNSNVELKKPEPVQIQPQQVNHFKRVMNILTHEYGYVDVSPFGAGKTHIAFAVAATFKLNLIVVGPLSTLDNWKKWAKIYGVNLICILTYQSLRGQSGTVNHQLLKIVNGEYIATDVFDQCVMSGLLLVFDEYHNLKNNNSQLASAHALVKSLVRLVRMGYKARIALLSRTPCDDKEYVTSTFKMLGIVLSDKLYNYNRSTKNYEPLGIQEAIDKCNEYDPDETLAISCRSINKATAKTICHELYTRVLKRYVVSSMPPPPIDAKKISRNYYILMPQNDVERLKKGLLLFKSATNYRHEVQEVDMSAINWGDVTTSRREIDSAKIASVCRLAGEQLERDPQSKILIYCNYKRDMETAKYLLARYSPLVMDGSTKASQRKDIISKFQEDSGEYRIIISNPKVGGIGIDLDDKIGNRPRVMYILPSYFFTDQYQSTGRIHRIGTKSTATIYFIYSRAFPYETGILNSMANKSKVVRDMVTAEQTGVEFPGEYDEMLELTPEEIRTGIRQNLSQSDAPTNETPTNETPTNETPTNETPTNETPTNETVDEINDVKETNEPNETKNRVTVETLYNILSNKARNDLEEDKYHAYGLYLEEINQIQNQDNNTNQIQNQDNQNNTNQDNQNNTNQDNQTNQNNSEESAVQNAIALMIENVRHRLYGEENNIPSPKYKNDGGKNYEYLTDYKTEQDLINFIEDYEI